MWFCIAWSMKIWGIARRALQGCAVRIEDDGPVTNSRPARSPQAESGSGSGLTGMRERAQALGGSLEAGPRPAGGFGVLAVLPLGAP